MDELVAIGRALSDPTRLMILEACSTGEVCVCQLVAVARLAPSAVSRHLAVLRAAQLIRSRRDGRWIHCRWPAPAERTPLVAETLAMLRRALDARPAADKSKKRIAAIVAADPVKLCRAARPSATARPARKAAR